jgi:tetratricopeptide (TPR) repeat protein
MRQLQRSSARGRPRADHSGQRAAQERSAVSPIFIHSSWRASHTWFWLKFRRHSSTLCFYEPFHEVLATLTPSEALTRGPNSWNSRHPASEPDLLEFIPLIRKAGGVRLFAPEISYRWFVPIGGLNGNLHPQELKYLALLIRHADRRERIPVFGFTRSLGRLAAIKKQFPGIHIFQYRNLWTQWTSWIDYKENENEYFFRQLLQIMVETKDIYLSTILNRYLPRQIRVLADNDLESLCAELVKSFSGQDLFAIYMAFHTYMYMSALKSADVVIDVTRVARDEDYRNRTSHHLVCATGLPIALDDVAEIQRYHSFDPALIDWKEIRENLELAVLTLDHLFERQELLGYGTKLLDETLAEIATSERYVATARDQITTLTSEREFASAAICRLTAEYDQLACERDVLLAERDRLWIERDALLAERDRLSGQHEEATAKLDRLTRELAAGNTCRENLIAENAHLRSEVARAVATVTQHASDLAALRLEQAGYRTELSRVEADRAQIARQSESWFNAAVVWPPDRDMQAHRPQRDQRFHRLKVWVGACLTGRRIARAHSWDRARTRANGARDARQWELAARFYADELNRNFGDAAIWVQFGHALKVAGRLSEAEIAYREAVTLNGPRIDALLSLGHVLSLQNRRAEAGEIYTRALDLEIPPPLRSEIEKELAALYSRTEAALHMAGKPD